MLIEMKTLQAGPLGTREPGKRYDVPDKEAKTLIEGGYAVEVKRGAKPQRATGRRGEEQAVDVPAEAAGS